MARKPRIHYHGALYHVTVRGNNRDIVYHDNEDKDYYLALMTRYQAKYKYSLYAYTLMDNHVHLLLEVTEHPLAKIMQGIQQSYTHYYNRKYAHVGHVFQQRYKAKVCERDAYLLMLVKYIHVNPIKAGIAATMDYPWSSHGSYLKPDHCHNPIVNTELVLNMFSCDRKKAIAQYINFMLKQEEHEWLEDRGPFIDHEMIIKERKEAANSAKVTLEELLLIIARETGVAEDAVRSSSKVRKVVTARRLIIYVALHCCIATGIELSEELGLNSAQITRGFQYVLENDSMLEIARSIHARLDTHITQKRKA